MFAAHTRLAVVAGLALVAAPAAVAADGPGYGTGGLLTPLGEYALVGGGVGDFADEATRDRFGVGGAWELRIGLGSRSYLGGELAYVGSAFNAEAGADLLTNGAEAVLRAQYPYATGEWLVAPFAFGGVGWTHATLRDAPPGLDDADDVGVVPFGAGVTVGRGRLLLDARFTYRASFDEDLALGVGESPASLERWGVTASVGYEF